MVRCTMGTALSTAPVTHFIFGTERKELASQRPNECGDFAFYPGGISAVPLPPAPTWGQVAEWRDLVGMLRTATHEGGLSSPGCGPAV